MNDSTRGVLVRESWRLLPRYVMAYCIGGTLIASALAWSLFYLTEGTRSSQNPGEVMAAIAATPLVGFFMFPKALATFGTPMLVAAVSHVAFRSACGGAPHRAAPLMSGASASIGCFVVQSVGLSDRGFAFLPWIQFLPAMVAAATCALLVAKFSVRSEGRS